MHRICSHRSMDVKILTCICGARWRAADLRQPSMVELGVIPGQLPYKMPRAPAHRKIRSVDLADAIRWRADEKDAAS